MSQSVKDYYLRLHTTRKLVTNLSRYYKGMKGTSSDIFSSESDGFTAKDQEQLTDMKKTLLDTTTGGYFLKDIMTERAFSLNLPEQAESYFSLVFESDPVGSVGKSKLSNQRFIVTQADDAAAYNNPDETKPMSTKDVVAMILAQYAPEASVDIKKTRELENDGDDTNDEIVFAKDKDGNQIYGHSANSTMELKRSFINQRPKDMPDRLSNPTLGAIEFKRLVQKSGRSSGLSIANRNSDMINLFFNAIPPLEMSRCVPFINMYIITPSNATIDEFNNVTFMRFVKSTNGDRFELDDNIGVSRSVPVGLETFSSSVVDDKQVTGMDIFLSPQVMSNANVRSTALKNDKSTMTGNTILEPISPYLTLEKVSTSISSAGQALLQSKTASFTIKLHDRSRLKDVAAFVSPEQFGMTKVFMEYGWSHPQGDINSKNDFGRLLNSLRDVGLYTVSSTSFSLGDSNTVSIDVKLACMGGANDAKNVSAANGLATQMSVLRPVIERAANQYILEKTGQSAEQVALKEIRKVMKVNQRKLNSGTSMVYHDKFLELAAASGFSDASAKASNKELLQLFKKYLEVPEDGALAEDVLSKESIVELLYGKLYGLIETSNNIPAPTTGNAVDLLARPRDPNGSLQNPNADEVKEKKEQLEELKKTWSGLLKTPDPFLSKRDDSINKVYIEDGTAATVSLGKLLMSFVGHSLAASGRCDEVQMFFYPLNNQSGKARVKTTASFPIEASRLIKVFKQHTRDARKANITVKSLFNLIEKNFVSDPKYFAYGLTDTYSETEAEVKKFKAELEKHNKDLEAYKKSPEYLESKKPGEKEKLEKQFCAKINDRKKKIKEENKKRMSLRLDEIYKSDGLDQAVETKFVIPNISMLIETVPALAPVDSGSDDSTMFDLMEKEQGSKHITRVHVYDERAAANSDAKFYQQLIEGLGVMKISGGSVPADNEKISESGVGTEPMFVKEKLEDQNINGEKREEEVVVVNSESITTEDLKDKIKDYFPNVTFGSNNSTVKSLSFQSSTSGDVNNVLLLNSLNNKKSGTPSRTDLVDQEDVRVIPSTVTLNCMGLPVIQRGNQLYIDTGTGTTLDNIYTVTNVTHTIGPGDFSTSLTLTCTNQGDTDSLRDKIRVAEGLKN
tara:strand:- start:3528 stop:6926 length:3399 start_codon:yes stop_codon:yes gene_type:complete